MRSSSVTRGKKMDVSVGVKHRTVVCERNGGSLLRQWLLKSQSQVMGSAVYARTCSLTVYLVTGPTHLEKQLEFKISATNLCLKFGRVVTKMGMEKSLGKRSMTSV